MAVSFTLVDLRFLVQQSFSSLQPLTPSLAKVNKSYELYRHYNALVIALLVGKIPKMKFPLSCTSSRQGAQKILPARGTACISGQLCPFVTTVCFAFYFFCTPNQSNTSLNNFSKEYVHIYFYLVLNLTGWQDLSGLIKYCRLEVQLAYFVEFAQFLLRFAPRLTFLHSKLVLHSLESLFTRVNLHFRFQ